MVICYIKERCKELGVTHKWLSENSGIPKSTISDAAHSSNIGIYAAVKIAKTLRCNLDDLWKC